jgi:hypothetical protein
MHSNGRAINADPSRRLHRAREADLRSGPIAGKRTAAAPCQIRRSVRAWLSAVVTFACLALKLIYSLRPTLSTNCWRKNRQIV